MKHVFFHNSSGNKLVGILEYAGESDGPIAIIGHGAMGSKENSYVIDLAKRLNKEGIVTFRIDFNSHGESEGKFSQTGVQTWADDLKHAFIKVKEFDIDTQRIGLFGYSLSASASIVSAPSLEPRAIVSGATITDFKKVIWEKFLGVSLQEWKEKGKVLIDGNELHYNFFEQGIEEDFLFAASNIKCPTLVVHGEKDSIVPIEQGKNLYKTLNSKKNFIEIKGADHSGMNDEQYEDFLSSSTNWFAKHL
jgi:alpha/beta superfamily hydrolase